MKTIPFNQGIGIVGGAPLVSIDIPNPLPGTIWITRVAEQYALELLGVFFTLTTDATVAARVPFWQCLDVTVPIGVCAATTSIAANSSVRCAYHQGQGNNLTITNFIMASLRRT